VIEVRSSEPLVTVRATAFGSTTRFFSGTDDVWLGLIGIDLDTQPDEYPVAVRATTGSGETVRTAYTLVVEAKEFQTRRLSVSPNFVNPPAEVLDRIQHEATRQAQIFGTSTGGRQWRGGFLRPVGGEATSSFGRRSVYNGEPRSPHSGTDFRSAEGTPIRAPNAGTVVLAGDLYFSGNVVIVDHGWGLYSYFAHLSAIDVAEGDLVESGQVVGKVGATGRVTGPHLHWTVRLNEARVDPLSLMALFPAPADE
jgi:murein DD-endopeptidase MepM/ murein hydrolase activator NlpD